MSKSNQLNELLEVIQEFYPNAFNNKDAQEKFIEKCSPIIGHDLENFFSNSSVSEFFRINTGNLHDSLNIDYDGRTYIRIMKLFKQNSETELIFDGYNPEDAKMLNDAINAPFYLRFYLPKNIISTIGKKINRIVVMFNGMNEIESFALYDILGEFFANNNIAAVLLPTPLHLNRRIEEDYKRKKTIDTTNEKIQFSPTDRAKNGNHQLFYISYLKCYRELIYLVDKMKGKYPKDDLSEDFSFYENNFDKDSLEVTLLGYSLGGLKALGYFMKDFKPIPEIKKENLIDGYENNESLILKNRNQTFHSCITINSGPNLIKVNTNNNVLFMDLQDWGRFLGKIHKAFNNDVNKLVTKFSFADELLQIFAFLYYTQNQMGEDMEFAQNKVAGIIDNYLAITGGADPLVTTDLIQKICPEGLSINQLIVAKGDHHPSLEKTNWHEMLPMVEESILNFINSCGDKHYKKIDIVSILKTIIIQSDCHKEILEKCHKRFHREDYNRLINGLPDQNLRKLFIKYYYKSKAFYPNFPEIIKKIHYGMAKEKSN